MEWVVDLKSQAVRHTEIAFTVTFSGVPGTKSFDGRPNFPPGLNSQDKVRLIRESYEVYAAAYHSTHRQSAPTETRVRSNKPIITVKRRNY